MPDSAEETRWFRLWRRGAKKDKRTDISRLLDLYWGGPERRITGLTLRIIGVNAIALLILVLSILYLGQYQKSLPDPAYFVGPPKRGVRALRPDIIRRLSYEQGRKMVRRLSKTMNRRIRLFNEDGELIADSHTLGGVGGRPGGRAQGAELDPPREGLACAVSKSSKT